MDTRGEGPEGRGSAQRTLPVGASLLVGLVVLVAVTVVAVLAVSHRAADRAVTQHAGDAMAGAAGQVRERVRALLMRAEAMVSIARGLLDSGTLAYDDPDALERYLGEHMRANPEFAAFYFGAIDGDFVFVRRQSGGPDAGYLSKLILVDGARRQVELRYRGGDFRLTGRGEDAADRFDPRVRPWFRDAVNGAELRWTAPYVFYSTGAPGVSAARRVHDTTGSLVGVVALDIDLSDLAAYLQRMRFSANGASLILARDGSVIAARPSSPGDRDVADDDSDAIVEALRVGDLGDPIATAAAAATGVSNGRSAAGAQPIALTVNGTPYFVTVAALPASGADWVLLSYAPQRDFAGWFASVAWSSAAAAVALALLVVGIGAWFVRRITQPLRAMRGAAAAVAEGRYGDITAPASRFAELRAAERALHTMANTLRRRAAENEMLYGHLVQVSEAVQQSPAGIALVAADGTLEFANPGFRALLAPVGGSMIGAALADLAGSAAARAQIDTALAAARAGEIHRGEIALRRGDGRIADASLLLAPILDQRGRPSSCVVIVEDISERKASERAMVMAMETAVSANQAKGEFLANMSHELRTPLNAIIGFAQVMDGQLFGPLGHERYKGYARDIESSGRHLLAIVSDMLDMARIDVGKLALAEDVVDVAAVIGEATAIVAAQREARAIALDLGAIDVPRLRADPDKLRQVLVNLLTNAVKFTRPGGRVRVEAGLTAEGDVAVTIADTGIGMSRDDVALALKPFTRVRNDPFVRDEGGVGLGLPISDSLIALHGGRLVIDSTPGAGTTVRVILPRSRIVGADAAVELSTPSG